MKANDAMDVVKSVADTLSESNVPGPCIAVAAMVAVGCWAVVQICCKDREDC